MGIGFVLLVWLVFWMIAAVFASGLLGVFTRWFLRRSAKGPRRRAVLAAVALPPVAVVATFVGLAAYGLWCETVRGVDAGLGDGWRVPLGSGYQLMMIDTPEQAFVTTPSGSHVGFGLRRIGYDAKAVYLEVNPGKFILIEKATGRTAEDMNGEQLDMALQQFGSPRASLGSPEDVYARLRWSWQDVGGAIAILVIPCLLAVGVLLYVMRVRRGSQEQFTVIHRA